MKNIFLTLLIGVFFLSFASASIDHLGSSQLGECVNLLQTCSDCTYNNITGISFPNSSLALSSEVVMTRDDTVFNYTFCNTVVNGEYRVDGFGNPGGTKDTWNYIFEISPSGSGKINQGEGSTLLGVMGILFLVIIFFSVATIYIQNKAFKVFFGALSVLLLVATLGFGVTIMQQLFGTFTNLIAGYNLFFRLFVILLSAAGIGLVLFLVVFALKSFNRSRGFVD